jgi:hypothetical protein
MVITAATATAIAKPGSQPVKKPAGFEPAGFFHGAKAVQELA